jgi:GcrA cell cycle regulator
MSWTDERIEQLKSLWTEGLSASHIAKVMGGVSRNAVIGKVHRLGLAGRACAPRGERLRLPSSVKHAARVRIPEPPIVEEDPVVLEDGSFATVLTISDRMCRWPIGDPADNEFHFCGRKPKLGSPYCEAHARKAYQPHQLRVERRRMAG